MGLIDCGFSRKVIMQRLQEAQQNPQTLVGVFVTHEHGDHAKGVQALCELLDIPIFSSFGTARKMGWTEHALWQCSVRSSRLSWVLWMFSRSSSPMMRKSRCSLWCRAL